MTDGLAGALPGAVGEVTGGDPGAAVCSSPVVATTTPIRMAITASASRASPAMRVRLLDPVPFGLLMALRPVLVARVDAKPASGPGPLATRPQPAQPLDQHRVNGERVRPVDQAVEDLVV